MNLYSRRYMLAIVAGGIAAIAVRSARADGSARIGPGETVMYAKLATNGKYTKIQIKNEGPGTAKVTLTTEGFSEELVLKEGEVRKTAKIFKSNTMEIANASETATVRIKSKWL